MITGITKLAQLEPLTTLPALDKAQARRVSTSDARVPVVGGEEDGSSFGETNQDSRVPCLLACCGLSVCGCFDTDTPDLLYALAQMRW